MLFKGRQDKHSDVSKFTWDRNELNGRWLMYCILKDIPNSSHFKRMQIMAWMQIRTNPLSMSKTFILPLELKLCAFSQLNCMQFSVCLHASLCQPPTSNGNSCKSLGFLFSTILKGTSFDITCFNIDAQFRLKILKRPKRHPFMERSGQ